MPEVMPELSERHRLISVVICPNGYQALIEERISIAFHPHFIWVQKIAKATTPVQAIKEAICNGTRVNEDHPARKIA